MGRVFRSSTDVWTQVLTTRLISISVDAPTIVVASTGAKLWDVTMIGPSKSMAYGDSSITISSAGLLFYSMTERFGPFQNDFTLYFRADSIAGTISLVEFE